MKSDEAAASNEGHRAPVSVGPMTASSRQHRTDGVGGFSSGTRSRSYRSPVRKQNRQIKSKKPSRLVGGFAPAEVSLSYRARSNAQIIAKRNHENFFLKTHPGKAAGVGGLNHERAFARNRMGFLARIFFRRAGILIISKTIKQIKRPMNTVLSRAASRRTGRILGIYFLLLSGRETPPWKKCREIRGGG